MTIKRIALILISMFATHSACAVDVVRIKVCRHSGLYELMDSKTIQLPAGASFTNQDYLQQYVVRTVANAKIGPKPACAIVQAEVADLQPGAKLTGTMVAQFSLPGATLEAHIVK